MAIGNITPVERRTVSEQVATILRERILAGELRAGERLGEVDLAERLGVSRNPLREAFRQLIGEGLLVYRPHQGVFVWRPNRSELWELLSLRAAIEGMAVRLALMEGRRDELVVSLEPLVEQMFSAQARDDTTWVDRADEEFHDCIIRAAHNDRLDRLWRGIHPSVWLVDLPGIVPSEYPPIDAERHRRLINVIAHGTIPEAHEAIIAHVLMGKQDYLMSLPVGGSSLVVDDGRP